MLTFKQMNQSNALGCHHSPPSYTHTHNLYVLVIILALYRHIEHEDTNSAKEMCLGDSVLQMQVVTHK